MQFFSRQSCIKFQTCSKPLRYRGDKSLRKSHLVYKCDFEVATLARQKLHRVAATKASYADVLRLVTRSSSLRTSAWEATVVSENAFCQGMVVLLNPVCNWLSEMIHVYKSEVRVAVFRDVMTSKTLASIQRLKIVELFGPSCLKLREGK